MSKDSHRTVWSSEQGDLRRQESKPRKVTSLSPQQQTAYLHRDSKGRRGGVVTLVKNLVLSEEDRKALARRLKQACGSGGTIRGEIIEIQGEHRERIAEELRSLGYKVKIAGG